MSRPVGSGGLSRRGRCYGGKVVGTGVAPTEIPHRDICKLCDRFVGQLIRRQRRGDRGQPRRSLGLASVEDLVYVLRRTGRRALSPAARPASSRSHIPSQAVLNCQGAPEPLTPDCAAPAPTAVTL